jgi:hypothetical protein
MVIGSASNGPVAGAYIFGLSLEAYKEKLRKENLSGSKRLREKFRNQICFTSMAVHPLAEACAITPGALWVSGSAYRSSPSSKWRDR